MIKFDTPQEAQVFNGVPPGPPWKVIAILQELGYVLASHQGPNNAYINTPMGQTITHFVCVKDRDVVVEELREQLACALKERDDAKKLAEDRGKEHAVMKSTVDGLELLIKNRTVNDELNVARWQESRQQRDALSKDLEALTHHFGEKAVREVLKR